MSRRLADRLRARSKRRVVLARRREIPHDRPLLSVAEAALLMGISESKAYELAREGTLPGLVNLPGHRQVVRRLVLERWLAGEDAQAVARPTVLRAV